MRTVIPDLKRWRENDTSSIALATIVEAHGSGLWPTGTRMALTKDGQVAGSVSGGCVDGDVIAEMEHVLNHKVDIRRPAFGISDEEAWGAGLSCGGTLELLVEHWQPLHDAFLVEIDARNPVGFASRIDRPAHLLRKADGTTLGSLGDPEWDAQVMKDIVAAWPGPYASKHQSGWGEVFVEVVAPPLKLVIFGATDIARALVALARPMGFEVVVSDARRAFLNDVRFPEIERRLGWPQHAVSPDLLGPGCAVVVLFHDEKFDVPSLSLALHSEAFYVGLLGSRKTQRERRAALDAAGFGTQALDRIHGPAGLDIGGRSPQMIALSILAEIVAVRHGRAGAMMSSPD
jgi:xanthine dehydrogenase accessory factor